MFNESKQDAIKIIAAVLLMLSFKIDLGCPTVVVYLVVFSYLIYSQIKEITLKIQVILCNAFFNTDTISFKMCLGKVAVSILTYASSLVMATSMLIFIYLSEAYFIILLFIDAFIFVWMYGRLMKTGFNNQLSEKTKESYQPILLSLVNVLILSIFYYSASLVFTKVYPMFSTDIPNVITNSINHSCHIFQAIARTMNYLDLNIHSLRSIGGVGSNLFTFIYLTGVSLLPFIGITWIYRKFLTLQVPLLKAGEK